VYAWDGNIEGECDAIDGECFDTVNIGEFVDAIDAVLVITGLGLMGIELCLKAVTLFCKFEDDAIGATIVLCILGVTYVLMESEDCIGTMMELRLVDVTYEFKESEDCIGT